MGAYRKVLCAVDLGEGPDAFLGEIGEATLRAADREATVHNAELAILHAVPNPGTPMTPAGSEEELLQRETLVNLVVEGLSKALERIGGRSAEDATFLVEDGPAGRAIIDAAKRIGADLIVVGCAGAKGLRRLLLGSAATEVVREAKTSVLVVRP
jgi:nucleotide-binding universal stress UspA family protein